MSDDLVELLLESELNMDHGAWATCREAAVEILRLRAEIEKLRARLEKAHSFISRADWMLFFEEEHAAATALKETGND